MEEINNIRNKLNFIRNTHPNIYKIWSTYINEKLVSMFNLITECNNILNKIENENIPDLTDDNMLSLLILLSFNNEIDMT